MPGQQGMTSVMAPVRGWIAATSQGLLESPPVMKAGSPPLPHSPWSKPCGTYHLAIIPERMAPASEARESGWEAGKGSADKLLDRTGRQRWLWQPGWPQGESPGERGSPSTQPRQANVDAQSWRGCPAEQSLGSERVLTPSLLALPEAFIAQGCPPCCFGPGRLDRIGACACLGLSHTE